jgi:hypothetical protein
MIGKKLFGLEPEVSSAPGIAEAEEEPAWAS